jgi:hypothetical protein
MGVEDVDAGRGGGRDLPNQDSYDCQCPILYVFSNLILAITLSFLTVSSFSLK